MVTLRNKINKIHSTGTRADIQYLRAFAVLAVLAYHYWPDIFVGGFIGVDVFFAISGFLITSHLLREYEQKNKINIVEFWSRRIRRLLPASLTVIAVTTVVVIFAVPKNLVQQFLDELAASTLYFENFKLANNAVDYLAAENIASPVQHFWSLGVEEQFYLVWPLVMLLAIAIATLIRIKHKRVVIFVAIGAIVVLSFWSSVAETFNQNPAAYFVTNTRAWELGVGALLAVSGFAEINVSPKIARALRILGWAALLFTTFAFNKTTPFPGFSAALPVVAAALLLALTTTTNPKILAPVRFVGDISYSVYLWHWPLLILAPCLLGNSLDPMARLWFFALSIILGWLSKRYIEDPTRNPKNRFRQPRFTLLAATTAMAVLLAVNYPVQIFIQNQIVGERTIGIQLFEKETPCFGALAWSASPKDCKTNGLAKDFVTPTSANVRRDLPLKYQECQGTAYSKVALSCTLGVEGGTRVAVVGDSHAYMWIDALNEIAIKQNWEIHTYVRAACPFSHVNWPRKFAASSGSCEAWNTNVDAALASGKPYKYLFTSLRAAVNYPVGGNPASIALTGIQKSWQPMIDRGTKIIDIREVPASNGNQVDCALKHPKNLEVCQSDASKALSQKDWLFATVPKIKGAYRIDMTRFYCRDQKCPQIIGHVFVYRDDNHITSTYIRTLAPMLWQKIQQLAP